MVETIGKQDEELDVLVVGAGISGIGAGVHLQKKCPRHSYAIVEMRENLGGTWDLFRYPGIRSDSDMYTLGYRFKPWSNPKAIADGPSILAYLEETAREYGVDRKIRYGKRVVRAEFSSADARWAVDVRDEASGEVRVIRCKFLFVCTGYYRYEAGHTPEFPGRDRFEGRVVHPQHWTDDIDYTGKKVVVIGSGATAVTLVPAMAGEAEHVTMLQRSPTYVISRPDRDPVADWLRDRVPEEIAHMVNRWKNWGMQQFLFRFSRRFPERARAFLLDEARKAVGDAVDVERHFSPSYDPWDERMCLIPNGDLFDAVKSGQASVVTDTIETFTERGIQLSSGDELEADLVVTATGLHVQLFGGAELVVDGRVVEASSAMAYRAMMLSDVPNLAFAVGYTNASWTLKVDITCDYVCRLLNHMEAGGHDICVPERDPKVREAPLLNLDSGYLKRALNRLPVAGASGPWRVFDNYARERFTLRRASVDDGVMKFSKKRPTARWRRTDAA
jgi:cation diffusion facilitator CzcD-associated flavoprotein CzcO